MLELLVTIIVVLLIAGIAIWLLSFLTLDAKIMQLIRGLIIIFAVLFVILTLWRARGALMP
jgi:hypothetical protein